MQSLHLSASNNAICYHPSHTNPTSSKPEETQLYLTFIPAYFTENEFPPFRYMCSTHSNQQCCQSLKNDGTTPSKAVGRSTAIKKIFLINFLHTEAFGPFSYNSRQTAPSHTLPSRHSRWSNRCKESNLIYVRIRNTRVPHSAFLSLQHKILVQRASFVRKVPDHFRPRNELN